MHIRDNEEKMPSCGVPHDRIAHELTMPLAGLLSIQADISDLDLSVQEIFEDVVQRLYGLVIKYSSKKP